MRKAHLRIKTPNYGLIPGEQHDAFIVRFSKKRESGKQVNASREYYVTQQKLFCNAWWDYKFCCAVASLFFFFYHFWEKDSCSAYLQRWWTIIGLPVMTETKLISPSLWTVQDPWVRTSNKLKNTFEISLKPWREPHST